MLSCISAYIRDGSAIMGYFGSQRLLEMLQGDKSFAGFDAPTWDRLLQPLAGRMVLGPLAVARQGGALEGVKSCWKIPSP